MTIMLALDKRGSTMDPQDVGPKKGHASQKLLEMLKTHLSFLARRGELDSEINDETIEYYRALGEKTEVTERFLWTARRAMLERRLAAATRDVPKAFYTFGHLLREIRCAAEVSIAEIGDVLGRHASYINDIESGDINPLRLEPLLMSEIAILYSLPLSVVERSIRVDATQRASGETVGSGLPRIPKGGPHKRTAIEAAHEDLTYHLARNREAEQTLPTSFLEDIRAELKKRGREDLFGKSNE